MSQSEYNDVLLKIQRLERTSIEVGLTNLQRTEITRLVKRKQELERILRGK
jgi:hypothetical protein